MRAEGEGGEARHAEIPLESDLARLIVRSSARARLSGLPPRGKKAARFSMEKANNNAAQIPPRHSHNHIMTHPVKIHTKANLHMKEIFLKEP